MGQAPSQIGAEPRLAGLPAMQIGTRQHASCDALIQIDPTPDVDGDGIGELQELLCGSHPLWADSTPNSDDDGDGTPNRLERHGAPGQLLSGQGLPATPGYRPVCSGAFGVVLGGYECRPDELVAEPDVYPFPCPDRIDQDDHQKLVWCADGRAFLWDPLCLQATYGDYAACRASTEYGVPVETTNLARLAGNGYGWRLVPLVDGINELQFPGPCDVPLQDDDMDGILAVRICILSLQVRSVNLDSSPAVSCPNGCLPREVALLAILGDPDETVLP